MADWAKENDMGGATTPTSCTPTRCRRWSPGYVDELNSELNRWETIKKWELLDHDLTVESGELTPSMKVKRNVVEANYQGLIDSFYA